MGSDVCPHVLTAMDKELILVPSNPVFVYLTHRNYVILSLMFCSIFGGPLLTLGILSQTILNIYYPGNSIRLLQCPPSAREVISLNSQGTVFFLWDKMLCPHAS